MLCWETKSDTWNAKIVNKTSKKPHVEIRTIINGLDILVVVSLVGEMKLQFGNKPIEKCNIRISSNLPIKLNFDEWDQLKQAVEEAKEKLTKFEESKIEQISSSP